VRLRLPFGRRSSGDAWHDEPGDALPVEITRLVAESFEPDPAALERVGATVRAAFVDAAGDGRLGAMSSARRRPAAASPFRPRLAPAGAALLAVLALGTVAAAESDPGEPFYGARVALESVFLPGPGSGERLAAQLDRLDARVFEASRAADAGAWQAAAAALDAYTGIAADVLAAEVAGPDAMIAARLLFQERELEALRARASGPAEPAADAALREARTLAASVGVPGGPGERPSPGPASPLPGSPGPTTAPGAGSPVPGSGGPGTTGSGGSGPTVAPTPAASGTGAPSPAGPRPSGTGPGPSASPGGQGPCATPAPSGGAGSGSGNPGTSPGGGPGGSETP